MAKPYPYPVQELLMLREAVASVSLSHPESCRCTVCRAAQGDEEAMVQVVEEMRRRGF